MRLHKYWKCIPEYGVGKKEKKKKECEKTKFSCHTWEWAKQILVWNCPRDNLWNLKLFYLN
jgi:hypothetical protein